MELVLASASLRRQQMLVDLGVPFKVFAPNVDESRLRGEPAAAFVQRLAQGKAMCVAHRLAFLCELPGSGRRLPEADERLVAQVLRSADRSKSWAVLAADTTVVDGKSILGKPSDRADALRMLRRLSGRTHEVLTGFCWIGCRDGYPRLRTDYVRTKVTFADMPVEFWKWYVATDEPLDKAGAYAAQGIGISFIEKVSGSYSNVIGLPLPQVLSTFSKLFRGELRECCGAVI